MNDPTLKNKMEDLFKEVSNFEMFAEYLALYDKVKFTAQILQTDPKTLIAFFLSVGTPAIKRTLAELKKDLPDLLREFLRERSP